MACLVRTKSWAGHPIVSAHGRLRSTRTRPCLRSRKEGDAHFAKVSGGMQPFGEGRIEHRHGGFKLVESRSQAVASHLAHGVSLGSMLRPSDLRRLRCAMHAPTRTVPKWGRAAASPVLPAPCRPAIRMRDRPPALSAGAGRPASGCGSPGRAQLRGLPVRNPQVRVEVPAQGSRVRELLTFLALAVLIWPFIAVGVVAGWGFLVWIYYAFTGPPGPV
jgi:nitrate reductase NapE